MATTRLPFGVISAPGYRYHPAILGQGAATLAEMFPGRFWLALGSGQRLNEDITGLAWPEKSERNARLRECAEVIRSLLAGEEVTHHGRVTVVNAKLYSRPAQPPALLGAAVRGGLRARARVVRWLPRRREPLFFRDQPVVRLHAGGYDVSRLGTFPERFPR